MAFEPTSGFSPEMRQAILAGLARRGLFLFVHATTEAAQREALDWGARGIMHSVMGGRWRGDLFAPRDLSDEFVTRMKASGAYQVTTLSLMDTWPGYFDRKLLDDPQLQLVVPAEERATAADPNAVQSFADGVIGWAMPAIPHAMRPLALDWVWTSANLEAGLAYSQRNLLRLYKAGVPLVVGTDAPSPWPYAVFHFHGWQTPREVELVAAAGVPPMEAIVAATRRPAEMLGIAAEVGTVEVGKRADLLIVRGDPLADVRALRRVVWTVRDGVAHTPAEWMQSGV
jgi:imidazolonepropionase-like amidohydrolase